MSSAHTLKTIVLDDDPTGTQSASGVTVILDWNVALLDDLLRTRDSVYVLTNTRAMSEADAVALLTRIRIEADALADRAGYELQYVLRGDSTLRGHVFPESDAFMTEESILVFVPAFPAGGRVTQGGRHFVTLDGRLVPAHLTEYADDPVFPFDTSDLREYVKRKSGRAASLRASVAEGADAGGIADSLLSTPPGEVALFDASEDHEFAVLAEGIRLARRAGKQIVVRCASPLAAQLAGVESTGLLDGIPVRSPGGVLVVCGSHTAGATAQLDALEPRLGKPIEIDTDSALVGPEAEGRRVAETARRLLAEGRSTIVASSRVRRPEHNQLSHGAAVMATLTAAVKGLSRETSIVVSKGGITSADVARAGLGAETAEVLGQILPGVSLWGLRNRHDEPMLYVVVPGNVGDPRTLEEILEMIERSTAA